MLEHAKAVRRNRSIRQIPPLLIGSVLLAAFACAQDVAAQSNLSDWPQYKPEQIVAGTIRNFGFGLGGVLKLWEEGFPKIHPDIRFDDKLPASDGAVPALVRQPKP